MSSMGMLRSAATGGWATPMWTPETDKGSTRSSTAGARSLANGPTNFCIGFSFPGTLNRRTAVAVRESRGGSKSPRMVPSGPGFTRIVTGKPKPGR